MDTIKIVIAMLAMSLLFGNAYGQTTIEGLQTQIININGRISNLETYRLNDRIIALESATTSTKGDQGEQGIQGERGIAGDSGPADTATLKMINDNQAKAYAGVASAAALPETTPHQNETKRLSIALGTHEGESAFGIGMGWRKAKLNNNRTSSVAISSSTQSTITFKATMGWGWQ